MKATIDIKVKIEEKLLRKLEVIVSDFHLEVSGFLIGSFKDNNIILNDIIFPKQEVSGASVDIKPEDVLPLRNDKRWKDVIGLWHSHCNMQTFWSGGEGDESHIKFLSQAKNVTVFIVSSFNQDKYNHLVRVEIQKPIKISIDEIPLNVIYNHNNKENILKEVKDVIVKKKEVVYQFPYYRKEDSIDKYNQKQLGFNDVTRDDEREDRYFQQLRGFFND